MSRNRARTARNNDIISGRIVRVFSFPLTLGEGKIALSSDSTPSLKVLSSLYRLYRFTRVKVTFLPYHKGSAYNDEVISVQYTPSSPTSAIPFADNESAHLTAQSYNCTVPMSFVVDQSALTTDHQWFITENEATEESADVIGSLLISSSDTGSSMGVNLIVEIDYHFKGMAGADAISVLLAQKKSDIGNTKTDRDTARGSAGSEVSGVCQCGSHTFTGNRAHQCRGPTE